MRATKATLRARYCADVERLVVAQRPALAGRMDWDAVLYHFLCTSHSAQEAADAIVASIR